MAVSFVASTDATFATAASIAQTTPAGIQDDDGLFAFVMSRDVVTPPAGWTELENQSCTDGGTTQHLIVYRKDTVTSSDSSTLFTFNNASSTRMGLCYMVARATGLLVAETTSSSITIIDFVINQSAATATRTNELFFYAATTITTASSGETAVVQPAGSTLATQGTATDYRLATAYVQKSVGESVTGAWNMYFLGTTPFYNGLATVTLRLVDTVVEDTIDDDIVHYAYALHGNQSTELASETVNFWAANNFKRWTDSQSFHIRDINNRVLHRSYSSDLAASLEISTFVSIIPQVLHLIVVSSTYDTIVPTGWTVRAQTGSTGVNGSRYLKVLELTDRSSYLTNGFNTDLITIDQGIPAPMAVFHYMVQGSNDGQYQFIAASSTTASNATTDQATLPIVTATNERETLFAFMTSEPHSDGVGSGYMSDGGWVAISPNTFNAPTFSLSDTYNIVGLYKALTRGQSTTGVIGYHSTPTNTEGVALMSAVLRYYSRPAHLVEYQSPRLQDYMQGVGSPATQFTYTNTRTEALNLADVQRVNWAQLVTEAPALTGVSTFTLGKPVTATAVAYFLEAVSPLTTYLPTLTEAPRLVDPTRVAWPKAITESTTLTPAASVAQAARVLEALGLLEALLPVLTYGKTVSETILARDLLARFASGEVIEALNASVSLAGVNRFSPALTEALGLATEVSRTLVLRVVSTEAMNLSDTRSLQLLLKPTISETVELTLAYVAPGDSFTTWTINARTGAVSEYLNYGFNSFAEMGRLQLGASSGGLYELIGSTDAGTNIIGTLKTGYQSFGDGRPVQFKAVYLGVRGGGTYYLKVDMGDGRESVYQIVAEDMKTSKVNLGKGLRARYFAFELISAGQDFDLESIEFVPVLSTRHR